MINFSDSRDPIFDSRDPIRVPRRKLLGHELKVGLSNTRRVAFLVNILSEQTRNLLKRKLFSNYSSYLCSSTTASSKALAL